MLLLLLAVPILLPIVLALFGVGQRYHYVALSVGTFVLAVFVGLMGREVKSESLFGVWALIVAAVVGCVLASLVYRRRSAAE
jgi:O-antigen/teichoic acid export membrane protein